MSMNEELTRSFNEIEVCLALKQMYPFKANGLDGMPPLFFQNFWSTSGVMVTKMVLDYRPISLCNVVYKIASKVYIYIYISFLLLLVTLKVLFYTEG